MGLGAAGGQAPVVAVVDADREAGRQLADDLVGPGYRVAHATRGQEVLGLVASEAVVVAVVDVSLEDMTGAALLVQLRRLRPTLPVIVTTADHGPEVERLARALGIVHYAQKPVWPGRLRAVLSHVLRRAGPLDGPGRGCHRGSGRSLTRG